MDVVIGVGRAFTSVHLSLLRLRELHYDMREEFIRSLDSRCRHDKFQRLDSSTEHMLQASQLGPCGHERRILRLDAHQLAHAYIRIVVSEDLVGSGSGRTVTRGASSSGVTVDSNRGGKPLPEAEGRDVEESGLVRVRRGGGFECAQLGDYGGFGDVEVEGDGGGEWRIECLQIGSA